MSKDANSAVKLVGLSKTPPRPWAHLPIYLFARVQTYLGNSPGKHDPLSSQAEGQAFHARRWRLTGPSYTYELSAQESQPAVGPMGPLLARPSPIPSQVRGVLNIFGQDPGCLPRKRTVLFGSISAHARNPTFPYVKGYMSVLLQPHHNAPTHHPRPIYHQPWDKVQRLGEASHPGPTPPTAPCT